MGDNVELALIVPLCQIKPRDLGSLILMIREYTKSLV